MGDSNELRVFVSSTFRDLQEEREHLVKTVFPEVRALYRKRGVTFTEVDLRWGLTDEDVVLGQVISACLEEVDKCRPYFIGITGSRYGFIPSYLDIQKDPTLLERFAWIEEAALEQMSKSEMEATYGVFAPLLEGEDVESVVRSSRFYFRTEDGSESEDITTDNAHTDSEIKRLVEYQNRIRASGATIREFRDAESLGALIFEYLVDILNRDFADAVPPTPLDDERVRHEAFSMSRRHAYIANPDHIQRLDEHVTSDEPPLMVFAKSGSGKSSLLAHWAKSFRKRHPGVHVVEHFVGIGAAGSDRVAIIRHLCMELASCFDIDEQMPETPNEFDEALTQWFALADFQLARRGEKLVIVVDGLDQLGERQRGLQWLPQVIPPSIRLIVSSTSREMLDEASRRGWSRLSIAPLTVEERETVIVRYLAEYRKALNSRQIKRIAEDPKCAHPLFLRTFLEELRLVGRHEELDARIEAYLQTSDTEDLFQRLLERMELDHGMAPVRELVTMLWCSRTGLDERELTELTGLSRLKISSMTVGLDYHLVRKRGELTFFHGFLRDAVEHRYLDDDRGRRSLHLRLADYFAANRTDNAWRVTDEPWHLLKAEEWERLGDCVTDLDTFRALKEDHHLYDLLAYWRKLEGRYDIVAGYVRKLRERPPDQEQDPAEDLHELANAFVAAGTYRAAEWMYRTGLSIRMQNWGPGDVRTLRIIHALAALYYRHDFFEERHERSARLLRRAVALVEQHDVHDPDLEVSLTTDLGAVLIVPDTLDEAESLYQQALKSVKRHFGDRDRRFAEVLNNLGVISWRRERYEDALRYFTRALELNRFRLGDKHQNVAANLSNIGSILARLGRHIDAESATRQAFDIARETRGADHPDALLYMSNLVKRLKELERYDDAIRLVEKVIAKRARVLGDTHPLTMRNRNMLGRLLIQNGETNRGILALEDALCCQVSVLGRNHVDTQNTADNLRTALIDAHRQDEVGKITEMLASSSPT